MRRTCSQESLLVLATRGKSQALARASNFLSDQGAKLQEYWWSFEILQRRAGEERPLAARLVFHHGLLALVLLGTSSSGYAQTANAHATTVHKEESMTTVATGPFDVKIIPQTPDEGHEAVAISRMLLDKHFHGDLEAASLGQMLAFRSAVDGSAGYVAMERVTGTLNGRSGSFVLQHNATMAAGKQFQDLRVVPDSGTDELTGLSGTMVIKIEDGKHFYEFEYSLPEEN